MSLDSAMTYPTVLRSWVFQFDPKAFGDIYILYIFYILYILYILDISYTHIHIYI